MKFATFVLPKNREKIIAAKKKLYNYIYIIK